MPRPATVHVDMPARRISGRHYPPGTAVLTRAQVAALCLLYVAGEHGAEVAAEPRRALIAHGLALCGPGRRLHVSWFGRAVAEHCTRGRPERASA